MEPPRFRGRNVVGLRSNLRKPTVGGAFDSKRPHPQLKDWPCKFAQPS